MGTMRTPDSDDSQGTDTQGSGGTGGTDTSDTTDTTEAAGGGDAGLLAEGFDGSDPYAHEGSGTFGDDAFGAGSADGGYDDSNPFDEPSFLQDETGTDLGGFDDPADAGGGELSAFEFDSDYVPDTDTDWDLTGDGVVDHHDAHEALTGFHDFHVDPEDSHGHAPNEGFFHDE